MDSSRNFGCAACESYFGACGWLKYNDALDNDVETINEEAFAENPADYALPGLNGVTKRQDVSDTHPDRCAGQGGGIRELESTILLGRGAKATLITSKFMVRGWPCQRHHGKGCRTCVGRRSSGSAPPRIDPHRQRA